MQQDIPLFILQVKFHSTNLRTFASVGTASKNRFRRIALSTQTHAQSTMHKHLQFRLWIFLVDGTYLLQTQFSRQHHLLKSLFTEETYFLRCAIVHLGTAMQGNWRQIHFFQTHILYDERIHTHIVQFTNHLFHLSQFRIIKNGVNRHVYLRLELMSVFHQSLNVLQRVTCCLPSTKLRRTNIHGIGTMTNRLDTDVCRFGWCKQLKSGLVTTRFG